MMQGCAGCLLAPMYGIEFVNKDNCHMYFTGRKSSPIDWSTDRQTGCY